MDAFIHHWLCELILVYHSCLVFRRAYGTVDGLQKYHVMAPGMIDVKRCVTKFNVCCSDAVPISLVDTSLKDLFLGQKLVRLKL